MNCAKCYLFDCMFTYTFVQGNYLKKTKKSSINKSLDCCLQHFLKPRLDGQLLSGNYCQYDQLLAAIIAQLVI